MTEISGVSWIMMTSPICSYLELRRKIIRSIHFSVCVSVGREGGRCVWMRCVSDCDLGVVLCVFVLVGKVVSAN